MKFLTRTSIVLMLGLAIISCSVVQKENPEKDIRLFLSSFQNDLTKSNKVVLSKFQVSQSKDALLSLIGILQNKDPYIICETFIGNSKIFMDIESNSAFVEIPTTFRVKELNSTDTASQPLVLRINKNENKFTITKINGEEFFQAFKKIKNRNQWKVIQKLALEDRSIVYENAKYLEEKFDSVIWFTKYSEQIYFYVVSGEWKAPSNSQDNIENISGIRMGLVDADGQIIIPIEYDLIGTIGFEHKNLVEVTRDGKHGYFSLERKELVVEPNFDLIIPYGKENAWTIVKNDTTYGWIDDNYLYTPGYTSMQMEAYVKGYDFLKKSITLKPEKYNFCEIPSPEYIGNGIIIPTSYFSMHGIFEEIEWGFVTTEYPMNGWTEYKESKGAFLETVTANIRAVIATIQERYLEGREEFYTSNKLIFIDEDSKQLGSARIPGEYASIHAIDSSLIEVRNPHDYWFMEEDASAENNLFRHSYFAISDANEIIQLNSDRLFPQTQFVRLDSAYLTGNFSIHDFSVEEEKKTTFLSVKTITFMRNEILASYGFDFEDEELNERFDYIRKEKGLRLTFDQFEVLMTDVDEYNVLFLNKILGLLDEQLKANPV